MSIPQFSQVVIGFGNSRGQTVTRLLCEQTDKINRVNIKSIYGANPKVGIKQVPEVKLAPFSQMIYKKRDESILREMISNELKIKEERNNVQRIKLNAQRQVRELTSEMELLRSFHENDDIEKVTGRTGCTQLEARKYVQKCGSHAKAIQKILENKRKVEQVSKKFQCSRQEAKEFLEANNYSMSVLG